jgi:hypothetical protein
MRSKLANLAYDYLDIGKSPHMADCIFIPSGKRERKICGLKMWRFGYATKIILGMKNNELPEFQELAPESESNPGLSENINADSRHFFIMIDRQDASCSPISLKSLGLRAEARALRRFINELSVRSLLIVTSPAASRRTSLIFRRTFRKSGIRLTFVAIPEKISFKLPSTRKEIWSEFWKYFICRLLWI